MWSFRELSPGAICVYDPVRSVVMFQAAYQEQLDAEGQFSVSQMESKKSTIATLENQLDIKVVHLK